MAISFGKVGSGSGSGGGSSNIGYVSADNFTTNVTIPNKTWTSVGLNTPAFQITNKSSAKSSLLINSTIGIKSEDNISGISVISVRPSIRKSTTKNGLTGTFSVITELDTIYTNNNILTWISPPIPPAPTGTEQYYIGYSSISIEYPFDTNLLNNVNDNDWVEFGFEIYCNIPFTNDATTTDIKVSNISIAYKSFGIGPSSTNIGTSSISNNAITSAKLADGSVTTNKLADNAVTNPKIHDNAITPSKVEGITPSSSVANYAIALNNTGTQFIAKEFPSGSGGGSNTNLSSATGILAQSKGGTGKNATSDEDLKNQLGIGSGFSNDDTLLYSANVNTQPAGTVHRIDSSTSNTPNDVGDGLVWRVGNDQRLVDLLTNKIWIRTLTDNNDGQWSNATDADDITEITTAAGFRGLSAGDVGYTTTSSLMPQYTNRTNAAKVIVANHNDTIYIASNKNNSWWAKIPTGSTWTAADLKSAWKWMPEYPPPSGVRFIGGEHDEQKIQVGDVGIIGGRTGIHGDNYVEAITNHSLSGNTSTYKAYFMVDDATGNIKTSTNTVGITIGGDFKRSKLDIDGIADTIITKDKKTNEPVFHGIIPEISDMHFTGYTIVSSQSGMQKGEIFYQSSSKTCWVIHKDTDPHLDDLFHPDFEVEIKKDDDNYVKGVFDRVNNFTLPSNVVITGAVFRSAGFETDGTLSGTVEIKGHKSVITKTDHVLPVNLSLPHGSSHAGKLVAMNSTGDNFALTTTSSPLKAMLILKQTTNVSISGSTTQWTRLTTQTGAWQLANKSTDYIEFNGSGLAYCSAGDPDSINVQVQLLYRHASTESGLSGAWTQVNLGTGDDAFFRSKLYAGNSDHSSISHRDYHWVSGSRIIPLSNLSGASDGNYIHFTIQMRKEDLHFANISEFRNTFLSCKVWDGSIIHSN